MFRGISQSNHENEIACVPSDKGVHDLVSTCTPRVNHLTVRAQTHPFGQ